MRKHDSGIIDKRFIELPSEIGYSAREICNIKNALGENESISKKTNKKYHLP